MSSFADRILAGDVLANGVDDWVYAGWVHQIVRRSGVTDPAQLRELAVGLIAELIVSGLVVPGDYDGDTHQPWECSAGEAIGRIAEEWLAWGDAAPTPGAIVWLALSPAGAALGAAVLQRESA
jgi:hypothetical protein